MSKGIPTTFAEPYQRVVHGFAFECPSCKNKIRNETEKEYKFIAEGGIGKVVCEKRQTKFKVMRRVLVVV